MLRVSFFKAVRQTLVFAFVGAVFAGNIAGHQYWWVGSLLCVFFLLPEYVELFQAYRKPKRDPNKV